MRRKRFLKRLIAATKKSRGVEMRLIEKKKKKKKRRLKVMTKSRLLH